MAGEPSASAPTPRPWWRTLHRNPWFLAGAGGIIIVTVMRPFLRHVPDAPPVVGRLPRFALTDQEGRRFGSEQLRGKVYVANFFFTSCRSICPRLTRAMRSLHDRFARNEVPVHLVSFSVDPATDTPQRLRGYARENGADSTRWTFLTGPLEQVRAVVVDGFDTHLGRRRVDRTTSMVDISHAGVFAIVDGNGGIRGFYSPDEQGLDEIYHRAQHVLREQRGGP